MMRRLPSNVLRALLGLFVLASFWYWVAGVQDVWRMERHVARSVASPLRYDDETRAVTSVRPEARAAGIAAGMTITGFNGAPYAGLAQWHQILYAARPGEALDVEYSRADGAPGSGKILLARRAPAHPGIAAWVAVAWDSIVVVLMPLVCLLIGYWIVLAKPADRNAWLLLVLLTFPSVLWINAETAAGAGLAFRLYWYETLQLAASPALLLFGIYFPERSRIDRKVPWVKWAALTPYVVFVGLLYPYLHELYFAAAVGAGLSRVVTDAGRVINALDLACVALYLIFTLDKLRSASTADARRRLRVLTTGTAVGVGALLLVFVLLPHFGLRFDSVSGFWIALAGGLVFMAAPLTLAYVVLVQRAMDVRVIVRMGTRYAMARAVLLAAQWALVGFAVWLLLIPAMHRHQPGASTLVEVLIFLGLVVALRSGLQKRAQGWLDRRFFREAYDVEVVLNELSDEVRRFTETGPLLETVARRVAETLHVDQIAVLLRGSEVFHLAQAIGVEMDGALTLPTQASSVRYLNSTNEPA
ncbi:MAG: hypothetical protein WBD10_15245, partial [Acidobacteriaceae bacterium]